jgi:nucleotide-binding universal stress UspA family protein
MSHTIVVAFNDSAESQRALASAVQLAVSLRAELQAVTVMADLPAYTAYASVVDASFTRVLEDDRRKFYEQLHEKARAFAERFGVTLHTHLVEMISASMPTPSREECIRIAREHCVSWISKAA